MNNKPESNKAAAYVPPAPVRESVRSLASAIGTADKAQGTVGTRALQTLTVAQYITGDGTWQPVEGLPSLRTLAVLTTPRTGQPKGTTWILPSGAARQAAISAGGDYAAWLRRVESVRAALQAAADKAGKPKGTRAASQDGAGKGKKGAATVAADPTPVTAAPVLRDTVAAVLQGRPVAGLSQADADAIRADAAAIVAPESADATPESVAGALRMMLDAGYASPLVLAACRDYVARFGKAQRPRKVAPAVTA